MATKRSRKKPVRQKFSREYKIEAVRLSSDGAKTVAMVAKELGIDPHQLYRWRRQLERDGITAFPERNDRLARRGGSPLAPRAQAGHRRARFLKKSNGLLRQRVSLRYECIDAHADEFCVSMMCRSLKASKAGYYAWRDRAASEHTKDDEPLLTHPPDPPRQRSDLRQSAYPCAAAARGCSRGQKTRSTPHEIRRSRRPDTPPFLRHHRLQAQARRSRPTCSPALRNQQIGATNVAWASDITYIDTAEGWLSCRHSGLRSRRIVGWSMSQSLEATIVSTRFGWRSHAVNRNAGSFTTPIAAVSTPAKLFQQLLRDHGMVCSMSRRADCWDNAVVESFNATIKTELIHRTKWQTREEARAAVYKYIETWYNSIRLHSTLGYRSPIEFEQSESDECTRVAESIVGLWNPWILLIHRSHSSCCG